MQVLQVADAGVEIRLGIVRVAHAVLPRRGRHQLHQPAGALLRSRACLVVGFLLDHRVHQPRIDVVRRGDGGNQIRERPRGQHFVRHQDARLVCRRCDCRRVGISRFRLPRSGLRIRAPRPDRRASTIDAGNITSPPSRNTRVAVPPSTLYDLRRHGAAVLEHNDVRASSLAEQQQKQITNERRRAALWLFLVVLSSSTEQTRERIAHRAREDRRSSSTPPAPARTSYRP